MTHQRNHARISSLRRQTDALDADLKSKIRQISETRKDLLNIPAYNAQESKVPEIEVGELLRYAKFISRTTVPPTLPKLDAVPPPVEVKKEDEGEAMEGVEKKAVNGTSTPAAEPTAEDQNGTGEKGEEKEKEPSSYRSINKDTREWLNQMLHFEPWPEHLTIQAGALGDIQRIVEAGGDPGDVLSAEEKVERRRVEEEEKREREREREEAERRRAGGGGGHRRRETVEDVFNPDEM